ncbi:MAG: PQQ-binding-like beta-propeller repeat protein [Phycisphaeraceae bacterium]
MQNQIRSIRFVALFTCLLVTASVAADWPQWRGPDRLGTVEGADWPDALNDQTLKQLWRVELAEGYPGPIVSGGRVFTVETLDAKAEVVRAFDAKTGEQLWEKSWPGSMKVPFFARRNGSWIKATPATDGENLYVMGMIDELVCLNAATGDEVWRVDFKERFGTREPQFGQACSPLVDGDAVYVQAGLSVCKLDKKTGKTIWRAMHDQRDFIGGNFSSPVIETVAGKRQLLVQTRGELAGLDLESGDVLWRESVKAFRGMNILPPTKVDENHVFTSSYGGGSFFFNVTAAEDGTLAAKLVWNNAIEGYMSSPMVFEGHLYLHGRDKTVRCLELKTGKPAWETTEKYGEYWSSVRNGDRLLTLGDNGMLRLIHATPDETLKILSEHKISDQETWGHLAIVGDMLYIRELKGLVAYRWSGPVGVD